jgi:hypothetical protein
VSISALERANWITKLGTDIMSLETNPISYISFPAVGNENMADERTRQGGAILLNLYMNELVRGELYS